MRRRRPPDRRRPARRAARAVRLRRARADLRPDLHQGRHERQLGYDRAGQLSSALEMAFPLCTLRRYGYDGSGNRVRLAVPPRCRAAGAGLQ
ncbi:hypothetical protein AB0K48_51630 [Nonomuraea sp. NPDC055795]